MIQPACRFLTLILICMITALPPVGARAADDPQPSFAFGVMADVQYGDKDTSGKRHYRAALEKLDECVLQLNQHELLFTIQLGDIIDGNESPEKTVADLDRVLIGFSKLKSPLFHVVGNHCMNAGADVLHDRLNLKSFYYDFTLPETRGWRFIVLDGNDAGYGVLGEDQLRWLEKKLAMARQNGERVIMFNHFALLKAAAARHRMKEPKPVLKRIDDAGCVVACFAGHDHAGGYALHNGVHHVTVKGIVEAPEQNAFAVIRVFPNKLEEIGFGKEPSRTLKLNKAKTKR